MNPYTGRKHLTLLSLTVILFCFFAPAQSNFNAIRWSTAAPQPFNVYEGQAKVVNGKLYSFGGFDSRKACCTPTRRSYVYDPVLNRWDSLAPLPFTPFGATFGGVTHAGIATDGTNIFLAGGYTSNTAGTGQRFGTRQVYRYNVAANNYTALPSLPRAMSAGQLEFLDGKLYLIGGTDSTRTQDLGTVYMLDLQNQAAGWVTRAPLPNPRHHGGSAVVNGMIYYIGGQHDHDAEMVTQKDVHRYNPATDTWTKLADLPVPSGATGRSHISSAVVVHNGKIIVLAGETIHMSGVTNMVSSYDPATNSWTNLTPLPANRYSGGAALLGTSLYYTGGSNTATTFRGDLSVTENLVTIAPVADAYVKGGTTANANYGADPTLVLKTNTTTNDDFKRRAYLRFPVSATNILRAKLRIYGSNTENTANIPVTVKGLANNDWAENTITWNNAPAVPARTEYTNIVNSNKAYYEFDVTNFVKNRPSGGQAVSFVVLDTSRANRFVTFHSKENAANPPQLIIETDGSTVVAKESILFTQSSQAVEVEQGSTATLPEFLATSDNEPVSVTLDAVDDNSTTPSWLRVNGSLLSSLAFTSGSEISFDFDATNLSIGSYKAVVTANASGYKTAVLNIYLTVKAGATGTLANFKVNFQDSLTKTPAGWLSDFGQAYGSRTGTNQGTGNIYGWIRRSNRTPVSLVGNGRYRKSQPDTALATFMHMQADQITGSFTGVKVEGIWEAQVANGTYDVTVSCGDNDFTGSRQNINIEGVPAIVNFTTTTSAKFVQATITVTVSDGRLSIDAIGGANTKINYVIVRPSSTQRPSVVRVNPESGSQFVNENTSISTSVLSLPNGGIDNSTITPANVFLKELPSGIPVPANVNGTGGGDAITLVPTAPLKLNTLYQFTITSNVKDLSGAAFIPYNSTFTTSATPSGDITSVSFTQVKMPEVKGRHSSLKMGPDGKLYALTIDGLIKRFTLNTDGTLGAADTLYSIQDPTGSGTRTKRLAIGFTFDPQSTADNLVAYVSHSSFVFLNGPQWDGKISRLSGPSLENVQVLVENLPRSAKDHLVNSLEFGPDGALYFPQGSMSAMGRADRTWNNRPETILSGAVLRLDLSKLTTLPLNAMTLADTTAGTYNPYNPNVPLTIYASGVRNAYDLVWHKNGNLYVPANGSAAGGNTPASVQGTLRPDGTLYNGPVVPQLGNVQQTQRDYLFRVQKGGYYGHPNPKRGEYVMNGGNPTDVIDPAQVDAYPLGTQPDINWRGFAFDFNTNKSPNGAIEYRNNAFNGSLKGKLLVVRYSQNDDIIVLTPGGTQQDIVSYTEGVNVPGFSGFVDPLDLTEDTATGNIYVSEYGGDGTITLLRPGTQQAPPSSTPGGIITVNPKRILDNDVSGGASGAPRIVTIKNTGTATVNLASITMGGANPDQFLLNGLPSFPRAINAGDSLNITVAFNPTSTGLKASTINIKTVDSAGITASVVFRGHGTSGLGGSNEPSLQALMNLYEYPILVGDDAASTNVINSVASLQNAALLGEEVSMQQFVKAGEGNVTIEPLAVFGPTNTNPILGMGWYYSGDSTSRTEILTVSNSPSSNGQTVNVRFNGSLSFDPGSSNFGFYTRWPFFANRQVYSEDALNKFTGAIPHHVRVYPFKQGKEVVPNKYIVAFEETTTGFDYQDFVFVVNNVAPAFGPSIVTVGPNADTYVRNGSFANTNFGNDTSLLIKTASTTTIGINRNTYLRFPLQGVTRVTSAKLRLYGRNTENANPVNLAVFGLQNDSWSETATTWNNAPSTPTDPLNRILGVNGTARYYEVDVTEFVQEQFNNDKIVSFLINDNQRQGLTVTFNSKENANFKPQLVINTAPAYNNQLFVENRDRFPSNDFFVASRVQIPWTRDTVAPFRYNANHDTARIRIRNNGSGTLVVNKLVLSNTNNWRFLTLRGTAFDTTLLPLMLNPGQSADLNVLFVAKDVTTTARYALVTDNLTLETNDDKTPSKVLTLRGLWQREGEGSKEPNAQTMIAAFGYTTRTGFSQTDPDAGAASKPKGNEVISSYFVRADTTQPVYVRQLGAYHGCCTQTESFRWYAKGTPNTLFTVFTHMAIDAQSLLPRRSSPNNPAEGTFSTRSAFGFKVGGKDFTDTLLNPDRKIGIRVWRAIDPAGMTIPNTYIVANDYLGSSFTNFDYNDNMYIVTNIRPENAPAAASLLVSTPSAVDFGSKTVQTQSTFKLTLRNSGLVLSNGQSDPAVTIRGIALDGGNASEFAATMPSKLTLAAQDTASMNISFLPGSQGLKTTDLLVYYDNTRSPLRIPLYGIATNSGTQATVVNRIKSGSRRAMTINGKVWSSDTLYAFDNLEPFSNPSLRTISATDDDSVYLVEQSSNGDRKPFRYDIPVPNGTYHLRLHFAEIYWGLPGNGFNGGAGSRVMGVNIEGTDMLLNLDVVSEVGVAAALVKQVTVTVTDGRLNLNFNATVNRPMVCGVEVYRFDGSNTVSPLTPDITALPTTPNLVSPNQSVAVYPNPVKDQINVTLPAELEGEVTLQLVDVTGNIHPLSTGRVRPGGSVLNVNISSMRLKKGTYFLKVIPEVKPPVVTKLIIE